MWLVFLNTYVYTFQILYYEYYHKIQHITKITKKI